MKSIEIVVNGSTLTLNQRIGRGGEGDVYLVPGDNSQACKYYTVKDIRDRETKVLAMVKHQIAAKSNLVAFPSAVARARDGRFVGFIMNFVKDHKPLYELYAPGARKRHFPTADYRFLVRAATNIARAVASVHDTGCVIGDINHSGILISSTAIAALIDADSFQYFDGRNQYLCRVGVPEYTPPELQGKSLTQTTRTTNHDAFGLAVVIFQLLSMGKHPFIGTYSHGHMPLERAIGENRFVYSRVRNVGMNPPPGAISLADLPQSVANAFEVSFSPNTTERTSASNWITILRELEQSLKRCPANRLHYYSSAALNCPWCRFEGETGAVLFLPDFSSFSTKHIADPGAAFNLAQIWAAISTVSIPLQSQITPKLLDYDFGPSPEVLRQLSKARNQRIVVVFLLILLLPLFFLAPLGFLFYSCAAFYLFHKLSISYESRPLRDRLSDCHSRWIDAITDWQGRSGLVEIIAMKEKLQEARTQLEGLPQEKAAKLKDYQDQRYSRQLNEFLDRHLICDTKIHGIGPVRQAALTSYGIDTAADITSRVLSVPGFGPSTSAPLFQWRQKLERRFTYSQKQTKDDQRFLQQLENDIRARESRLQITLLSGPQSLRTALQHLSEFIARPDPALQRLHKERCEVEADLNCLGVDIPQLPFDTSVSKLSLQTRLQPLNQRLPKLTERDVHRYFGSTYTSRGDYYEKQRKVLTYRVNSSGEVTGTVQGSRSSPYSVKVVIDTNKPEVIIAQCTCPMGGRCKHSAALLLHCIRNGRLR